MAGVGYYFERLSILGLVADGSFSYEPRGIRACCTIARFIRNSRVVRVGSLLQSVGG